MFRLQIVKMIVFRAAMDNTTRLVVAQVVNCVMLDIILVKVKQYSVYPVKLAGMKMKKEVQIVATVDLESLHYKKQLLVQNVRKVNGVIN